MKDNSILDKIAESIGTVHTEGDNSVSVVNPNEAIRKIDKIRNEQPMDNNTLMPGMPVSYSDEKLEQVGLLKEQATDNLIQSAAVKKLKNENLNARIKEYVINSIIDAYKREFFDTHHYSLAGKELKKYTRMVNTKWKKGRIKITPKQKQQIIDYLNLSSVFDTSTLSGNKESVPKKQTPVPVEHIIGTKL